MKPPKKYKSENKQGGVLVMAVIVMLSFSILAIGLFKLRETAVIETVYAEHHKQAFWMAESGLTDGELIVKYSKEFRDNPTTFTIPQGITNEVVQGYYDIAIERSTVDADAGIYDYEITSVGHVKGQNRRLQKNIRTYPGGEYAIIGITGVTELASNVEVNGPIAQIEGDFIVKDSRGLDGYLIMGDGEDALFDKKGEATLVNIPPPPNPVIDYADYESAIVKASAFPSVTTTNLTETDFLSGVVNYFNVDEIIVGGTATSIPDNTTIVTTGNISFPKSHVTIGNNVTIIAKNFSIANQGELGGGTLIYTQEDIYLRNASDTTTVNDEAIALVARGNIEFDSQIDFRGVIFAENDVLLNANGIIEGTIIGGVGVGLDANITVNYDASVFKEGTPITPKSFGDVILTQISWRELSPL